MCRMKLQYARLLPLAAIIGLSACYTWEEHPDGTKIKRGILSQPPDDTDWKRKHEEERKKREAGEAKHLQAEIERDARIKSLERQIQNLTDQLTHISARLESVELAHKDAQRDLQVLSKEYSEVSFSVGRLREDIHGTPDASDGLKKNLARVEQTSADFQRIINEKVTATEQRAAALTDAYRKDKEQRDKKQAEMEAALKESEKTVRVLEDKLRAAAQEDFKDFVGILVALTAAMYLGTGGMIVAFFVGRKQSAA